MATTLRDLLIQRAARLQDRPALTTLDWGTLSYTQLRNRVEGVALGLLSLDHSSLDPPALFSATGSPWDWAAELAAAASGLGWDPAGQAVPVDVFGGPRFNHEGGRGVYHDREQLVHASTPFTPNLDHGELMARLRRLNVQLGWDHTTRIELPFAELGSAPVRAALWSALYAGAHAVLALDAAAPGALLGPFRRDSAAWDPMPFQNLWTA